MRVVFILLLSLIFFASCNRSTQTYDKAYFDFDSLVNSQVKQSVEAGVMLQKHAEVNGRVADSTFVVDSTHLANELDVFRQQDVINKPLYRNSYTVSDGEKDTKSNLLIRTYTFTPKNPRETSPISYVKFYYQESPLKPKRIESDYREKNELFTTQRNLRLEFDDSSGRSLLSKYKLEGFQKLILNDTTRFSVEVSLSPGR